MIKLITKVIFNKLGNIYVKRKLNVRFVIKLSFLGKISQRDHHIFSIFK